MDSDMAYRMIDSYIVVQCNSGAAIPSNSRQDMYILDYNENSTEQYVYKQCKL